MLRIIFIGLLATLGLPALCLAEEWQKNRITPLEKITVGPWDNFESTVSAGDRVIYYTRDQNQIPSIYRHNLGDNDSQQFIGEEGDAKDPILDPSAKLLAFTYYKNDAQGDICLLTLESQAIECVTDNKNIDESPFWLSPNKLGYLRRSIDSIQQQLVIYDLVDKSHQVIYQGFISSPTASPSGEYVVFNEVEESLSLRTKVLELPSKSVITPPAFDLPGTTGFLTFASNGEYLYFNRYLSDTNFDQLIDANDNSVAFRIPFQQWLRAKRSLLPEQLTSVENNCKFPIVSGSFLYLTCAFEGSLDIYRLPSDGAVASNWSEAQLWEAHQSARSYEDRLLTLNTIRYRHSVNSPAMLERLLSNHLEIGEYTAASFYIKKLEKYYRNQQQEELGDFYAVLERIINLRSVKQQLPGDVVTARYERQVAQEKQFIAQNFPNANYIALANASFALALNEWQASLEFLKQISLADTPVPMFHYLVFSLYENLLDQQNSDALLELYPTMFNDSVIPEDARLYYAFNYLKRMTLSVQSASQRESTIAAQIESTTTDVVRSLFEAELLSLQLIQAQEKSQRGNYFKQLTSLLKTHKDNITLRKIQHIRAIQNLGAANEFLYMELLSRNWLVSTHISEIEFYNVAEQYSVITMDKAYGFISDGELAKAFGTFYSSIRQTNDLEAHYQLITLGLMPEVERQKQLEEAYKTLENEKLLGEQKNYVLALRKVIEHDKAEKPDNALLNDSIVLLKAMPNVGPSTAMRELLLGYIYHQQLRVSAELFDFDKSLYQKAHYHYMMALDFGRNNTRIETTVWQNLAWLHFEVRNYGLSAKFFDNRLQLPFIKLDHEIQVRWAYAKALFYNYQNSKAFEQSEINLTLAKQDQKDLLPFVEKSAFYALQAKQYAQAIKYYEQLLQSKNQLSQHNLAKAYLGLSYALMKQDKKSEAQAFFNKVLETTNGLSALPQSSLRLVRFEPRRLDILALGFLAQLYTSPEKKINALQQRLELLKGVKKQLDAFVLDEVKRLTMIIKDYQHLALIYEKQQDIAGMQKAMNNAFEYTLQLAEESGNSIAPVEYRSIINYLSIAISHNKASVITHKELQNFVKTMVSSFDDIPYRTDVDVYRQAKLQILWAAYNNGSISLPTLLTKPELESLQSGNPSYLSELTQLIQNLRVNS